MADENTLWRAQTYALLATLLNAAPQKIVLEQLAALEIVEPDSPMGKQWLQLREAVEQVEPESISDEFQALFIGVTHGELIPYGCYYQTGFLMEEPLALLRSDLAKLGLERQQEVSEPEDHIAAQCDVMRLILMAEGTPVVSAQQFFQRHLAPWAEKFFADMVQAENAIFYRSVGHLGETFMQLEQSLMT
ncbi:MAG: molecular chaperone TorD family protein [Gammaproteobacteria bacterium]|nr:molecular chaperone TorD family protein [Gammaproteobacteria bacterium]